MKKLLLLPLFLFGSMTVSKAQAPVTSGIETKNGPVMTFEVLEYNFGTIKQGESVTREFKFKNTGREPLIINNAVGSCGCTVPEYPKEPIKPNGSGVIKVTFNSAGKMGQQDKTITLTYDTDKQIILHMKGNVEAAATPAPQAPAAPPQGGTSPAPKATATPATTTASPRATASPAPTTAAPKSTSTPATTTAAPKSSATPATTTPTTTAAPKASATPSTTTAPAARPQPTSAPTMSVDKPKH